MSNLDFRLPDDLTLEALRKNSSNLLRACRSSGTHWVWDDNKFHELPAALATFIRGRYSDLAKIPPHSRMNHFIATGQSRALEMVLPQIAGRDTQEAAKKLLELLIISVLCDGGAGTAYQFKDEISGQIYKRSEALGLASVELYKDLTDNAQKPLDWRILESFSVAEALRSFQVSETNPLNGGGKRFELLKGLARSSLRKETKRLGDILDLFVAGTDGSRVVSVEMLLSTLIRLMNGVWPERYSRDGVHYGDVFALQENVYPFHKLTQWMMYSILDALKFLKFSVVGEELLTALPEYRNGGLFLDFGVFSLRKRSTLHRIYRPDDPEIIEWRALTVAAIDELLPLIRRELSAPNLSLAQLLEAGTWAYGRELASKLRPGGEPPLALELDGTVF
jgi:hypothetical protein